MKIDKIKLKAVFICLPLAISTYIPLVFWYLNYPIMRLFFSKEDRKLYYKLKEQIIVIIPYTKKELRN